MSFLVLQQRFLARCVHWYERGGLIYLKNEVDKEEILGISGK